MSHHYDCFAFFVKPLKQSNYYFLKGAKSGRITAKGKVVKRTRKFCIVDVDVVDETGELVSKGTFDYYCVADKSTLINE